MHEDPVRYDDGGDAPYVHLTHRGHDDALRVHRHHGRDGVTHVRRHHDHGDVPLQENFQQKHL